MEKVRAPLPKQKRPAVLLKNCKAYLDILLHLHNSTLKRYFQHNFRNFFKFFYFFTEYTGFLLRYTGKPAATFSMYLDGTGHRKAHREQVYSQCLSGIFPVQNQKL